MYIRFVIFLLLHPIFWVLKKHDTLNVLLNPNKVNVTDIKIHYGGTQFLKFNELGKQFCTYKINNREYFRYSFTKAFYKLRLNVQLGARQNNYTYKIILKWQKD